MSLHPHTCHLISLGCVLPSEAFFFRVATETIKWAAFSSVCTYPCLSLLIIASPFSLVSLWRGRWKDMNNRKERNSQRERTQRQPKRMTGWRNHCVEMQERKIKEKTKRQEETKQGKQDQCQEKSPTLPECCSSV
mmetsp:Transcript_2396/g.5055  ORF Transcript_2396/g.5055 Transcript_2396/m.5055 type:complete len:135 (-) Transcript_2396:498-902(-)